MIDPAELMQLAIDKCRQGIAAGESPFGCAIARGDDLLAVSHNTVLSTVDITAHAEINALRAACHKVGDILLETAMVAATCEPCPMCMTALHWARVGKVYYGATIAEAEEAGFNELDLPASEVTRAGGDRVELAPGLLAEACRGLCDDWQQHPDARVY